MIGDPRHQKLVRFSRCERARELVSLQLDGEISEIERLLVRRHLGRCDECTAFAESVQLATDTLRGSEQQVPGRGFVVESPKPSRARLRLRLGLALVVVAAGLGALAGFLSSGASGPEPGEAPTEIAVLPPNPPPAVPDAPEQPIPEPGEEPIAPV